jgi:hypothetical protein
MELSLNFPCCLPVDPLGIGYGSDFFSKVHAGKNSTYTTDLAFFSKKNGCETECLGRGEIAMAMLLEISPFVLAYRCQYPMLLKRARDRIDQYIAGMVEAKPTIRTQDTISLDVLVTARHNITDQGGIALESPYYVALSHKEEEDLAKRKIKNRLKRERNELSLVGYKHVVFSRNRILDECGKAANQIRLWRKGVDFENAFPSARILGERFYSHYNGESLDKFLCKFSRRFNFNVDDVYGYFSVAVNFGFVCVDLSCPVMRDCPVQIIQRSEAVPPWISFSGKVNSYSAH